MFIHPTQNRSLTPREAARIQSFPDWFEFPVARTHQFRAIGNAVPPLVAEAVGLAVKTYLEKTMKSQSTVRFGLAPLPTSENEAVQSLLSLVHAAETKSLCEISTMNFLRGWFSVGFLYGGLHPDSALDHGTELSDETEPCPEITMVEPRLQSPRYVQSGWPVLLAPIADDAWRRYEAGELTDDQFYCSEAVIAGLCCRNPDLIQQLPAERRANLPTTLERKLGR